MRLLYALHGRIPYDAVSVAGTPSLELFRDWFLPLNALRDKTGTRPDQIPTLATYFRRALLARPSRLDTGRAEAAGSALAAGDLRWVMDPSVLSHLIPFRG